MNMCGAASKVIRDYKGDPKAWQNRDLYTQSRKATLYFQANCPETKAGKVEKAAMAQAAHASRVTTQHHAAPKARPATCKDCFNAGYKKGFKDGKSVGIHNNPATSSSVTTPPSYQKPPVIHHGSHTHHTAVQKADCELTDALNRRAGPVVKVVSRH